MERPVERPTVREERHAPPSYGSGTVLPSVTAPYHPPANEFRAPTSGFRAPTNEPRPPANEFRAPTNEFRAPTNETRKPANQQAVEDFLGMRGDERGARSNGPAHVPSPTITHGPELTPFRPGIASSHITTLPNPPGRAERGPRPPLAPRWQAASTAHATQFSHWRQTNSAGIASFQATRATRWNQIQSHATGASWRGQFRTAPYRQWRHNVWDFRRGRAGEIWLATNGLYNNLFDNHWWSTCWWRRRPWVEVVNVSPWWWWATPTWADEAAFYGPDLGQAPIPYDPGTNAFYDGNTYDVDGNDQGNAADTAQGAIDLANPPVNDYPVPEPAPEGQQQEWLPLGSWALSQQEQGDAVLYFQLSVDRDGLIGGGYKNALTGDEQPIVGRLDKRSQRLAWHIADNPQTVFETGLSSLNYDVAGVFVHFGTNQTQNWLLVRLPSPDAPPGPVAVPPDGN